MPDGNIMQYVRKHDDANRLMLVRVRQDRGGGGHTTDRAGNSLQRSVTASLIFTDRTFCTVVSPR